MLEKEGAFFDTMKECSFDFLDNKFIRIAYLFTDFVRIFCNLRIDKFGIDLS